MWASYVANFQMKWKEKPKRIYTSFGPFGMQPLQETHGKQKPIMTYIQLSLLAI
jgi:hypothetical protein